MFFIYIHSFSVSPVGRKKTKKVWNKEEITTAMTIFGEHIHLKDTPSIPECAQAITQHKVLQARSPTQLKAWVNNQINKQSYSKAVTKGEYFFVY